MVLQLMVRRLKHRSLTAKDGLRSACVEPFEGSCFVREKRGHVRCRRRHACTSHLELTSFGAHSRAGRRPLDDARYVGYDCFCVEFSICHLDVVSEADCDNRGCAAHTPR